MRPTLSQLAQTNLLPSWRPLHSNPQMFRTRRYHKQQDDDYLFFIIMIMMIIKKVVSRHHHHHHHHHHQYFCWRSHPPLSVKIGHHNILNPKPLRIPVLAMILQVVGLRHLCAEEAFILFNLKSICGNKATRHLQLNIHFNLRSTYTYTYTYTLSQKKKVRHSYGLIRTFHAASGIHLSSVLFARWAPRIKSWTFWRGSWHWSCRRKGRVAMTIVVNP